MTELVLGIIAILAISALAGVVYFFLKALDKAAEREKVSEQRFLIQLENLSSKIKAGSLKEYVDNTTPATPNEVAVNATAQENPTFLVPVEQLSELPAVVGHVK